MASSVDTSHIAVTRVWDSGVNSSSASLFVDALRFPSEAADGLFKTEIEEEVPKLWGSPKFSAALSAKLCPKKFCKCKNDTNSSVYHAEWWGSAFARRWRGTKKFDVGFCPSQFWTVLILYDDDVAIKAFGYGPVHIEIELSFTSKVIVYTHDTDRHIHTPNRMLYLDD